MSGAVPERVWGECAGRVGLELVVGWFGLRMGSRGLATGRCGIYR